MTFSPCSYPKQNSLLSHVRWMGLMSVSIVCLSHNALAQEWKKPALVVTNDPLPPSLSSQIYASPSRAPAIDPSQLMNNYFQPSNTIVSRKIADLSRDLAQLQNNVARTSEQLNNLQRDGQNIAADYYANIGTINTQLQSGTTPGNPRLLQKLASAQSSLSRLEDNASRMNDMSIEMANAASTASFLLEGTRAAYGLSGAVEEDHVQLAQLEDSINNTVIVIDRLQNNLSDDVTRTGAYLSTERNNLRTLSLAVSKGDMYGLSLANRPFSAQAVQSPVLQQVALSSPTTPPSPVNPRPLAKIKFDSANVNFEESVYMAMNNALSQYPNSRYELVAVHPSAGNAAQVAIETTKARRNAERVLRTMTQMGVPLQQVDISTSPSPDIRSSEVHIYIR
jgi:hypothetical protein